MNFSKKTIILCAIVSSSIIVTILITHDITSLLFKLILSHLGNNDRIIAIVDFLSSLLSSIFSAIVAYFIAKYQSKKATKDIENNNNLIILKESKENRQRCSILYMELVDNKKHIDFVLKNLNSDNYKQKIKELKSSLSTMAWNLLMTKIDIGDNKLRLVYSAYKSINTLLNFESFSSFDDTKKILSKVSKRINDALPSLNVQ